MLCSGFAQNNRDDGKWKFPQRNHLQDRIAQLIHLGLVQLYFLLAQALLATMHIPHFLN